MRLFKFLFKLSCLGCYTFYVGSLTPFRAISIRFICLFYTLKMSFKNLPDIKLIKTKILLRRPKN